MDRLHKYKQDTKKTLSQNGLLEAFNVIEDSLSPVTSIFDELMAIRGRYVESEKDRNLGVINYEEKEQINNQIRHSIISLINKTKTEDLFFEIKNDKNLIIAPYVTKINELYIELENIKSKNRDLIELLNLEKEKNRALISVRKDSEIDLKRLEEENNNLKKRNENIKREIEDIQASEFFKRLSEETCSSCRGVGAVRVAEKKFIGTLTKTITCPTCHGTGTVIKKENSD